jgi:PAS domain S-box-containing protein
MQALVGNDVDAIRLLRAFFRASADVIWVTHPDERRLLFVSDAYERIWSRSSAPLFQDLASWLETIHPDDRERIEAGFPMRAHRGHSIHTYRIVRPDGSVRQIREQIFPHRASGGSIWTVGIAADVTDQMESVRRRTAQSLTSSDEVNDSSVRMCAWTRRFEVNGRWVPLDEFLWTRFGVRVTHGVSPEAIAALEREIGGH